MGHQKSSKTAASKLLEDMNRVFFFLGTLEREKPYVGVLKCWKKMEVGGEGFEVEEWGEEEEEEEKEEGEKW